MIIDPQLNWAVFFGGPRHLPGTSHADELFLQVCNFYHFLLFLSFVDKLFLLSQWSPLVGIHIQ